MSVMCRRSSSSLPFLLGALAAAGCSDGDNIGKLKGVIEVNCCAGRTQVDEKIDTLDFGDVQVGIAMSYDLIVKNAGNGEISLPSNLYLPLS